MNKGRQQTILIVDDEPANIKILGENLKSRYKILIATSGSKAIEISGSSNPPDLILLDIVMPEMNGYEVCRRLKTDDKTRKIPIIFLTAMASEKDETSGLELGAVDYIIKPFSLPITKARVKTQLELKYHRDLLENLSTIDGLTGIPNRRSFDERITQEWKRAVRESDILSLIMMDIDYFKPYNDQYGHIEGDDCIKMVSQSLSSIPMRPADFVSRYGGEEFSCILPTTDYNGAVFLAEKMRRAIEELNIPHMASRIADKVTISLGVSTISPVNDQPHLILVDSADKCLYQAKESGRNRVMSINLTNSGG